MNVPADSTALENALAVAAYLVMRHGDAYAPVFSRLEAEVEAERTAGSTRQRAAAVLKTLTREVRIAAV